MINRLSSRSGSSNRFRGRKKPQSQLVGKCVVTNGLQLFLDAGDVDSYPTSGTNVVNLVDSSNSILTNGVVYSSSNSGIFTFDGSNDYIDTNKSFASESFTLSAWIKCNDVTGYRMIFSKEQTGGWPWNYRLYLQQSNGHLVGDIAQSGSQFNSITYNTNLADNNWHHVVFIRSVTDNKMYLYVDGSLVSTANNTLTGTIQNSQELWIGRSAYVGAYNYKGNISNVLIYNRDLSSSEILQNYNCFISRFVTPTPTPTLTITPTITLTPTQTITPTITLTPTQTITPTSTVTPTQTITPTVTSQGPVINNLVLHYDPSSYIGSGTVWDTTVGTTDATLSGSPTYNALSGFTFNGTSSYGRIPSVNGVTNFTNTQQYTVEIWFNPSNGQPNSGEAELLEKWNLNNESRYPYTIRFNEGASSMLVAAYDGSNFPSVSLTGFSVNTWRQLVAVFDFVGDTLTVYRNGISGGTTSLVGVNQVSNTSPVGIAGRVAVSTGALQIPFKGTVGIIRMYDASLTASQVLQNYNADKSKYGL